MSEPTPAVTLAAPPVTLPALPERKHLPLQYSDADGYVTSELQYATEATLFTPDAEVLVHMVKTRQGSWRTESSDHWLFTRREERARFATPQELMFALAAARHVRLTEFSHV